MVGNVNSHPSSPIPWIECGTPDGKNQRSPSPTSSRNVLRPRSTAEIRAWLAVMLKTFKLSRYQMLSMTIDGARAAAHWRVDIHSKITGVVVPTELVDLVEVSGGRITAYREFFAPC